MRIQKRLIGFGLAVLMAVSLVFPNVNLQSYADEPVENHLTVKSVGEIESGIGNYVAYESDVTLQVEVTADNDEEIEYSWYRSGGDNGDYKLEDTDDTAVIENITKYTYAYCKVKDKYGNTEDIWFNLYVENHFKASPKGAENGNDSRYYYVSSQGEDVVLETSVSGDDLEGIKYVWHRQLKDSSYEDLNYSEDSDSITVQNACEYVDYSCDVYDSYGNNKTAYFYIRVDNGLNVHPKGITNSKNKSITVSPNDTITLELDVNAKEKGGMTYEWSKYVSTPGGGCSFDSVVGYNDTLIVNNITESGEYHCRVTDKYGNDDTAWFEIKIDNGLKVSPENARAGEQSVSYNVEPGASVTCKTIVSANDTENIKYEWFRCEKDEAGYFNGEKKTENASGAELTVTADTVVEYRCRVTDKYGNSKYAFFDINIDNDLNVSSNAVNGCDIFVSPNGSTTLEVYATAKTGDLTYKWYIFEKTSTGDAWSKNLIEGESGSSLSINSVNEFRDYRCDVIDIYGNQKSVAFLVQVNNYLEAYTTGENSSYSYITIEPGESKTLQVSVTAKDATDIKYEWRKHKKGNGYSFDNNSIISGATGASIDTGALTESYEYQCTVTDKYGNTKNVNFNINVDNNFKVTPVDPDGEGSNIKHISVELNKTATLSANISANDATGITYDWRRGERNEQGYTSWTVIEGETGTELVTEPITGQAQYLFEAWDKYGNNAEAYFYINVDNKLQIEPVGYEVNEYNNAMVTVTPDKKARLEVKVTALNSEGITYKWYRSDFNSSGMWMGDTELEGENKSYYDITDLKKCGYTCRVYDSYGNSVSQYFNVNVDNNLTITDSDGREVETYSNYIRVEINAGESINFKLNVSATDTEGITYQWYHNMYNYSQYAPNTPIDGEESDSLDLSPVQSGGYYTCLVKDKFGNSTYLSYYVTINNDLRVLAEGDTENNYSNTKEVLVVPGGDIDLKVNVSGKDLHGLTYSWYRGSYVDDTGYGYAGYKYENNPIIGAATDTLALNDVIESHIYSCRIYDKYGNYASKEFLVIIDNQFEAKARLEKIYVDEGKTAAFEIIATATDPTGITYQWYKGRGSSLVGMPYDGGFYYYYYDKIEGATSKTLKTDAINGMQGYKCIVTDKYGNTKNVLVTAYIDNHLNVDPVGSTYRYVRVGKNETLTVSATADDTSKLTYEWWTSYYNSTSGYYTDSKIPYGTSASFTANNILESKNYWCKVSDGFGNQKTIYFYINVDNNLRFTSENNYNIAATIGGNATLEAKVSADDTTGLTYKWYKIPARTNGSTMYYSLTSENEIQGAIASTYTVENVTGTAEYQCLVKDKYGSSIGSGIYRVNIDNALTLTSAVNEGSTEIGVEADHTAQLSVTANATETDGLTYQWYVIKQNAYGVQEYTAITGAVSSSFTTENITGLKRYSCFVKDKYANTAYIDFDVFVEDKPQVVEVPVEALAEVIPGEDIGNTEQVTLEGQEITVTKQAAIDVDKQEVTVEQKEEKKQEALNLLVDQASDLKNIEEDKVEVAQVLDINIKTWYEKENGEKLSDEEADDEHKESKVTELPNGNEVTVTVKLDEPVPEGKICKVIRSHKPDANSPEVKTVLDATVSEDGEWLSFASGEFSTFVIVTLAAEKVEKQVDIGNTRINLSQSSFTYDGSPKTPQVSIDGLEAGTDYDITITNNINAGTASVVAGGKGKYTGTASTTFNISPAYLTYMSATLSSSSFDYDGRAKTPTVTINGLTAGTDYDVAYSNNKNAGTATVTITGKGNYYGSQSKAFTINQANLSAYNMSVSGDGLVYNGKAQTPAVSISGLKNGTDYTVSYSANTNAGTGKVTITGKGNYTGSRTMEFTISQADISKVDAGISESGFVYDGNAKIPNVSVKGLTNGTDYTVAYSNNINVGAATVTITGKGNYTGSRELKYTISAANISGANVSLSESTYTYDGGAKSPKVTVKVGEKTLSEGTDFSVSYLNNVNVGTATVTVSGKGNYSGAVSKSFVIKSVPVEDKKEEEKQEEKKEDNNTDAGKTDTGNTDTGNTDTGNTDTGKTDNNDSNEEEDLFAKYGLDDKYVPEGYVDNSGSPMIIEGKENCTWNDAGGKSYWYEGGIKQGTYYDTHGVMGDGTIRGREIYDGASDAWYWLDSCYDGAKAIGKEVWVPYIYQDEDEKNEDEKRRLSFESDEGMSGCVLDAMINKKGKWVRYDEHGKMLKGWVTIEGALAEKYPDQVGNTYYYDNRTGLMAKGCVTIERQTYFFDENTGVLQR